MPRTPHMMVLWSKFYDRRQDEISLDEAEKIVI